MPPARISFIHSVSAFFRNSMRPHLQPRAMRRGASFLLPSAEQAREQRHERHADERDATARDQLFHALAASAGVVLTVSFQQVYNAPDAEAGTERYNQRLQYFYRTVEKLHLKTRSRAARNAQAASPAPASFHLI